MRISARNNHEGSINAVGSYTSFKWSLNDWAYLIDYYDREIQSLQFDVAGAENFKCSLTLAKKPIPCTVGSKDDHESIIIVRFFGKCPFSYQRACVSVVDKEMNKLLPMTSSMVDCAGVGVTLHLKSLVADYWQQDTLIVFFELHSVQEALITSIKTSTWSSNFNCNMQNKLEDLWKTNEFRDVTFVAQKTFMPANKLVLALQSRIFEAMFTSKMENQIGSFIRIDDVDAKIFELFLRYMHTGKLELIEEVATELAFIAIKYEVRHLVNTCTNYMAENLKIGNAVQYLIAGDQLGCSSLVDQAVEFIKLKQEINVDLEDIDLLEKYPKLRSRLQASDTACKVIIDD